MSQLLPYVGVGVVLLGLLALWGRQVIATRKRRVKLLMPVGRSSRVRSAPPGRDLGERIFGPQDWDFIHYETAPDIQRMFERERTALAISWLRRTRNQASLVMRIHTAGVRAAENLQGTTELKLLLSYLTLFMLCDLLIGWVWLLGAVRTRRLVKNTLCMTSRLRNTFEQCMAAVEPTYRQTLKTHLN